MLAAQLANDEVSLIILLFALAFFAAALYLIAVAHNWVAALVAAFIGALILLVGD